MASEPAMRRRGAALVLVATILWSLAGLYTRLLGHLDLWTLLAGRAFFGALSIGVLAIYEWKRGTLGPRFGFGPLAPLLVPLSAAAISCYVAAIKTTTVADVLVIYATLPFVAAGLAYVITGERATRRTLVAAGIALVGVAIMVASGLGQGRWLGQGLSFVMTAAFGLMVVLQRRDPGMSMTAINAAAAALASALGFALSPHPPVGAYDLTLLFAFGFTTICVAFGLFMEGAKRIPAAEAGLISMLDVVLGPLWVYLAFGEDPGLATLAGGGFVLVAVIWQMAPGAQKKNAAVVAGPL